jgi:hypothetical protein
MIKIFLTGSVPVKGEQAGEGCPDRFALSCRDTGGEANPG